MRATIHILKTWPEYFDLVKAGVKCFEVRKNDRNYRVGEEIVLEEYVPEDYYQDDNTGGYLTGNVCHRRITYILNGGQFGIEDGYVVLGLERI